VSFSPDGRQIVSTSEGGTVKVWDATPLPELSYELASNRHEDHEVSMLALHLLQNCMIYINTLMLQQVLARPHWSQKLGARDLSALTPLIWATARLTQMAAGDTTVDTVGSTPNWGFAGSAARPRRWSSTIPRSRMTRSRRAPSGPSVPYRRGMASGA